MLLNFISIFSFGVNVTIYAILVEVIMGNICVNLLHPYFANGNGAMAVEISNLNFILISADCFTQQSSIVNAILVEGITGRK